MTSKDLYEFCYRADTVGKVALAEKWLREHKRFMSLELFEDLMETLDMISKRIFRRKCIEQGLYNEEHFAQVVTEDGQIIIVERGTGELVTIYK